MTDNIISFDARRKLSRLARLKAVRSAVEFRAVERILCDIWADRQAEKPPEFGPGGIDDLPV